MRPPSREASASGPGPRVAVAGDGAASVTTVGVAGPAEAGNADPFRNAHFGRAEYFDIFDIGVDPPLLLERRFTTPFCGPAAGAVWAPDHSADLVADCVAVLAAKIGPCARQALAVRDVLPVEHPGPLLHGAEAILAVLRGGGYRRTPRRARDVAPADEKSRARAKENRR